MDMDEACFQRMPLDFVGNTSTVDYHSANKEDLVIPALTTTDGTFPAGYGHRPATVTSPGHRHLATRHLTIAHRRS